MSEESFKRPFPPEVLLEIFSVFSFVEWGTDLDRHNPWNPFCSKAASIEDLNLANIATKHSLSLVSKHFNLITRKLLYEYVCIRSAYPTGPKKSLGNTLKSFLDSVELYTKRLDISRSVSNRTCSLLMREIPRLTITGKLLHLSLAHSYDVGDPPLHLVPGHSRLKIFSWGDAPLANGAKFLGNYASNLHVLDLTALPDRPCNIPFITTEIPNLHTLRIHSSFAMEEFLRIELPSLRVADIEVIDPDSETIFVAFVEKHGRKLTTLIFRDFSENGLDDAIKIDALPDLCELALCSNNLGLDWLKEDAVLEIARLGIIEAHEENDVVILRKCEWIADMVTSQLPKLKTVVIMQPDLAEELEYETPLEMKRILKQANVELEWT
ncbi:hypothetical protein DFH11DRAFT_1727105 [Phellopilus nigrolimitatus]|nr:hypothetical protein DFH11DRAFT_1727105 [Phellopilus nigrolimitatus]